MSDWADEQAARLVPLVRYRATSDADAKDLIAHAIRTGESRGALAAAGEIGERMVAKFDEAFKQRGNR